MRLWLKWSDYNIGSRTSWWRKSEVETKPSPSSSQQKLCRECNTHVMLCCIFLPFLTAAAVRLLISVCFSYMKLPALFNLWILHMGDMKWKCFQHWIYCSCCPSEALSGRRADSVYWSDVRLFKHYATHCFMATTALWRRATEAGYSS